MTSWFTIFLKNLLFPVSMLLLAVLYLTFEYISCTNPLTYKLGRFDAQFGISQEEFLAAVHKATSVWDAASSSPGFRYDPQGKITINLIYDERQQTTDKNIALRADVDTIKNAADSVKEEYTRLQNDLSLSKKVYNDSLVAYNTRVQLYEKEVSYWNDKGGAPRDVYTRLRSEEDTLARDRAVLETKRLTMNKDVETANAFIQKYNLLVSDANTVIRTINESAGKEFEEGNYDQATKEISIYEFSNDTKLTRVLAHELGHALTIDHNSNPLSVMYPVNQATTLTLSEEDIQALSERCQLPFARIAKWYTSQQ